MPYTKLVCATVLLVLFNACSSSQQSELSQQKVFKPEYKMASVPVDGKLRNEHIRMYASVKIKQEQLRYQNLSQRKTENLPGSSSKLHVKSKTAWEKAAIEHFEFDPQVYFWAKNMIDDTLINYTDSNSNPRSTISNISNPVIAHNLAIIKKFKEDLRFAEQYKLTPKILTTSNSALPIKPST